MKRLAILLMAAMLALPAPVGAQSPEPDDTLSILAFIDVVTASPIGDILGEGPSRTSRDSLREAVAADREALLAVVPSACWLPVYLGYWDALTLVDAAMAVFDTSIEASTFMLEMFNDRMQGIDPASLAACM